MQNWEVIEEKDELGEKISKLHKYLYTNPDFVADSIGIEDYVLLQKQLIKMSEYFIILQQRISKF